MYVVNDKAISSACTFDLPASLKGYFPQHCNMPTAVAKLYKKYHYALAMVENFMPHITARSPF